MTQEYIEAFDLNGMEAGLRAQRDERGRRSNPERVSVKPYCAATLKSDRQIDHEDRVFCGPRN